MPVGEALDRLADVGIRIFEVTAIDRDGTLGGPDLETLRELVATQRGEIIASAGIASASDIADLRAIGCRGAIVGRALYEVASAWPRPSPRPADGVPMGGSGRGGEASPQCEAASCSLRWASITLSPMWEGTSS